MAEIHIRKKRPIWPWVAIGLVLLAMIIYLLASGVFSENEFQSDQDNPEVPEQSEIGGIREGMVDEAPPSELTAYYEHIEDSEGKMGIDHIYTHRAFTLLTNAMNATAEETGYDFRQDMSMLKEKGDSILKDPMKLDHANTIKHGFVQVVESMNNMQSSGMDYISQDVATLEKYASNLNPDEPTLEQKELVKGFFDQASVILRTIHDNS
ncbi:hypothetical protein AB9P05_01620 [Roseivirga sp. BDSF3-8]|uniref:hypothetical protein n=1 Tax=Roseivirga sp. BDSF3-8 TaxID=3241598 RepID=UPI003531F9A6